MIKQSLLFFLSLLFCVFSFAQNSFIELRKFVKVPDNISSKEDSLRKQFEQQKLIWPPQALFVRSFKYDKQLEVWIKDNPAHPFKLFKTFKVCMQSGTMGPKRIEGDYQVPEGFYHINELNPNSNYHLSLGLNYPNSSDKILGDPVRPGGNIYIHGNCVSTGCIAIADEPIEELFILASYARFAGQEFIPVHVYPIKYNIKKSAEYLTQAIRDNPALKDFYVPLKAAYDKFESQKELPVVLVNRKGEYVIQ